MVIKIMWRCEHCYAFYEYKRRAINCHYGQISKFEGNMERKRLVKRIKKEMLKRGLVKQK